MKFFVDESTGFSVAEFLRKEQHDVLYAGKVMPQAPDQDILSRAVAGQRILITNDKDFGELIFRSGKKHAGVILLRLRSDQPAARVRVLKAALKKYSDKLSGHFCVITETEVRFRSI